MHKWIYVWIALELIRTNGSCYTESLYMCLGPKAAFGTCLVLTFAWYNCIQTVFLLPHVCVWCWLASIRLKYKFVKCITSCAWTEFRFNQKHKHNYTTLNYPFRHVPLISRVFTTTLNNVCKMLIEITLMWCSWHEIHHEARRTELRFDKTN